MDDAADVSDIVRQTAHNEIGIVADCRRAPQRAADQYIVANQGHEHRVFDVVIKCVAVAYTFERKLCRLGQKLRKRSARRTEPVPRFNVKKRTQRLRDQFRYGDHPDHPFSDSACTNYE
ncbi:MAG: hypothetical protein WDN50_16755 [Bradyrhizobium sp.]